MPTAKNKPVGRAKPGKPKNKPIGTAKPKAKKPAGNLISSRSNTGPAPKNVAPKAKGPYKIKVIGKPKKKEGK